MEEANFKMKTSTLKPPFAWVGGKSKLAKEIVSRMPLHNTYAEVFGGSLAVLLLKSDYAQNTQKCLMIATKLINLYKIIQTRPQSLQIEC